MENAPGYLDLVLLETLSHHPGGHRANVGHVPTFAAKRRSYVRPSRGWPPRQAPASATGCYAVPEVSVRLGTKVMLRRLPQLGPDEPPAFVLLPAK